MNKKDGIRNILRQVSPKYLYSLGANILNVAQIIRTNGLQTYLQLYHSKNSGNTAHAIKLRGFSYPVYFRPHTPDVNTITQNLIRKEYGQFPVGFAPKWIIDGGGYIGDVSIYFLNHFKDCRILMVEPDRENFELAKLNLAGYSTRVILIPKGLWSHVTELYLTGSYVNSSLISDSTQGYDKIGVVDVQSLMEEYHIDCIDLLKLDIEGAEDEILHVNNEWLTKTKAVVVEFHGVEIKKKCTQLLHSHGFRGFQYRSLHFFFRDDLSKQSS